MRGLLLHSALTLNKLRTIAKILPLGHAHLGFKVDDEM